VSLELWHCCFNLVGCQKEHLACKNWVKRYRRDYLSGARCRIIFVHTSSFLMVSYLHVMGDMIKVYTHRDSAYGSMDFTPWHMNWNSTISLLINGRKIYLYWTSRPTVRAGGCEMASAVVPRWHMSTTQQFSPHPHHLTRLRQRAVTSARQSLAALWATNTLKCCTLVYSAFSWSV